MILLSPVSCAKRGVTYLRVINLQSLTVLTEEPEQRQGTVEGFSPLPLHDCKKMGMCGSRIPQRFYPD